MNGVKAPLGWTLLAAALAACGGGGGGDAGGDAATDGAVTADAQDATATDAGDDAAADVMRAPRCNVEGGESCFVLPTAPVTVQVNDAGAPADLSCAAPPLAMAAAPVMVTGSVRDFQSGARVPNATVDAFRDDAFDAAPLATAMTNTMGEFAMTLPMGAPSRLNWRTRAPMALDTYVINERFDVARMTASVRRESISQSTANGLPALIGTRRTAGTGVVAGDIADCTGRQVMDAIATLSTASSAGGAPPAFVPGAQVYYFTAGGADLPTRRTERTTTNTNGLYVILQVPPTTGDQRYYLQLWGFRTAAAVAMGRAGLSLLGEQAVRVPPDVLMTVEVDTRPGT